MNTARNVVEYVALIKHILKEDGIWINLGDLNFAYEPYPDEVSIELTMDQFKTMIFEMGFIIIKYELMEGYEYLDHLTSNSLLNATGQCPFFVCKKDKGT